MFAELQTIDFSDALIRDTLLRQNITRSFNEILEGKFNRLIGVLISALYGRFFYKHEMRVYAKSLQLPVND